MSSPFDDALKKADTVIQNTIMSAYSINGTELKGVYDETPKDVDPMSGVFRTITLYDSKDYKPRKGDRVKVGAALYIVTGYTFSGGLIVLQLEEDAAY